LADNEYRLKQKERENETLMMKVKEMEDNMKNLIQVTKQSSDFTNSQKLSHQQDLEKIKQRSVDYQRKIELIQRQFD